MLDFVTAYKAHLPFIGVHTDDPVNVRQVLTHWTGKTLQPLPTAKNAPVGDAYVYWTEDATVVTTDMYRKLCASTASAVVINAAPNVLIYDTGNLETPVEFYRTYLKEFVGADQIEPIVQQLKGLSLKAAQEVVQLTMARVQSVAPHEVRKTRQMMGGETPGLSVLDTDYDFYEWPKALQDWVALNDPYFLNLSTPQQLVPRGLLLAGDRGVGKSMSAMVIAKHWDVPLFRLDVASSLNRWLGESESRIARHLRTIEENAPCVWLLDEAEKLFSTSGDGEGTPRRILSQFLWWLQYHKARVLTVITTNDQQALPPELYRAMRIDRVLHLEKLMLAPSKAFAVKVYESVLGVTPPAKHVKMMRDAIEKGEKNTYAHAEVRVLVYDLIKQQNWLAKDPA